MASLRQRKNQYESRIRIWDGYRQTEKTIPLRTDSKVTALVRHMEVEKHEKDIKNGIDFEFSWLQNNSGSTRVIIKGLSETISLYLEQIKVRGIAKKTMESYTLGLDYFKKAVGDVKPEEINIKSIDTFKNFLNTRTRSKSPTSINIHLKSVRAFLNWCGDRGYVDRVPKITLERVQKDQIKYFTESEYHKILSYKHYDDKRFPLMFKLYWETGMRLREGFYGVIAKDKSGNNWLDIPIEANKSRRTKSIMLNDEQVSIVGLIQNVWMEKGSSEHHIKYYSKVLRKVLREQDIDRSKHFHSLRHSYGVRRIIELKGNITQLRDEMGHGSVTVTEKYSKPNPKRLLVDFPSLKAIIEESRQEVVPRTSIFTYNKEEHIS